MFKDFQVGLLHEVQVWKLINFHLDIVLPRLTRDIYSLKIVVVEPSLVSLEDVRALFLSI